MERREEEVWKGGKWVKEKKGGLERRVSWSEDGQKGSKWAGEEEQGGLEKRRRNTEEKKGGGYVSWREE